MVSGNGKSPASHETRGNNHCRFNGEIIIPKTLEDNYIRLLFHGMRQPKSVQPEFGDVAGVLF
jgi:hypothetical protein